MVRYRLYARCLCATLAVLLLSRLSLAESVLIPGTSVPLCGIRYKSGSTNRLALKQYLSQFTASDIVESSLISRLDSNGHPCVRPVLQNTTISLVQRVAELGYADWDPSTGMLDLDTWIIASMHKPVVTIRDVRKSFSGQAVVSHPRTFPWMAVLIGVCGSSVLALVVTLGKLSPLLTPRSSIASLGVSGRRTKIRGIAIPTSEALSVMNTDVRAIAFKRVVRKYRHNGWETIEDVSDRVRCSVDDGTGCVDIDITQAQLQYSNTVTLYNDIPGEPVNLTPYVDDIRVHVQYIPVGAIVTVIGMLDETETGYRASRYVQVFAGDERSVVRRLRFLVFAVTCVLLFSSMLFFVLRQSS